MMSGVLAGSPTDFFIKRTNMTGGPTYWFF